MRDPMEAKSPTFGAGLGVPDDAAVEQAMHAAWMEAWALVAAARGNTKLLSLTIDAHGYTGTAEPFGRGWARARMWEQYAEKHQGICLLFHRERFQELLMAQLQERTPDARCGRVRYSREGMVVDGATTMLLSPGVTGETLAREHLRRHFDSPFFVKLLDWESEHEFRFVEPSDTKDFTFVDYEDTLAAIMVGAEFPNWQVPAPLAACDRAGADARRVHWEFMNRPMPMKLVHEEQPRPEFLRDEGRA